MDGRFVTVGRGVICVRFAGMPRIIYAVDSVNDAIIRPLICIQPLYVQCQRDYKLSLYTLGVTYSGVDIEPRTWKPNCSDGSPIKGPKLQFTGRSVLRCFA